MSMSVSAPSQAQQPATHSDPAPDAVSARAQIAQCEGELAQLRARADELHALLRSHGVGPRHPPLVGADGFPLPDVDHLAIASSRGELARLTNDRARIEARVHDLLPAAFAHESLNAADANANVNVDPSSATASESGLPASSAAAATQPIARIGHVTRDPPSPAHAAGVQEGDVLVSVLARPADAVASAAVNGRENRNGSRNRTGNGSLARLVGDGTPGPLRALPALVRDGQPLVFCLLRGAPGHDSAVVCVRCIVTPRGGWGGRGLLGCFLLPPETNGPRHA